MCPLLGRPLTWLPINYPIYDGSWEPFRCNNKVLICFEWKIQWNNGTLLWNIASRKGFYKACQNNFALGSTDVSFFFLLSTRDSRLIWSEGVQLWDCWLNTSSIHYTHVVCRHDFSREKSSCKRIATALHLVIFADMKLLTIALRRYIKAQENVLWEGTRCMPSGISNECIFCCAKVLSQRFINEKLL